jgi:23S rRNA (uracil-5-)-methyltransferase RumA
LKNTFDHSSFSCEYFPKCSGCTRQIDVRNPEVWKEICSFFEKVAFFKPQLVSKEIIHWRSRAKLAVRGTYSYPLIGLFKKGSHDVTDIKSCPLHVPVMDEAIEEIRKRIKECKLDPYQEKGHLGRLKYLQMTVDPKTLKIQLVLVFNGNRLEENEKAFVKLLYKTGKFHSIWVNLHPEKTNSIFNLEAWELIEGKNDFFRTIKEISFAFHPSCFSQAHISLFEEMIDYVDSLVESKKSIFELYAGVGCIGLCLAHKAKKLTLVESSPYAKSSFEKTMQSVSKDIQEKCFFLNSKVEEVDLQDAEIILVDPPRKGLSKECKEKIFKTDTKQLIYISCGYESFIRDCSEILEKGWKLASAKGFVLFPGTNHVEIIASFQRN